MTRPGDPGRRTIMATGDVEAVAEAAKLIGEAGAHSFEVRYDAADRHLADGEEPHLDERIRWQAIATFCERDPFGRRTTRRVIGEAVVDNTPEHGLRGGTAATLDLLEKLGANTVVIDYTIDADPRDP